VCVCERVLKRKCECVGVCECVRECACVPPNNVRTSGYITFPHIACQ